MYHNVVNVLVVCSAFLLGHLQILQLLFSLFQSWSICGIRNLSALQIFNPFLQWCLGHLVELVDSDNEIFWEQLVWSLHLQDILLFVANLQGVARMNTDKHSLSVIQIISANTQVKIEDAYGIHLLHLVVFVAESYVLGNGLRYAIQNSFKVESLPCQLYLNYDYFPEAVFGFYVHSVELVIVAFLVALAFQNLYYVHFLIQQNRYQSFQNSKVCLVSEHSFCCPVKSYIFVFFQHLSSSFMVICCKCSKKVVICKTKYFIFSDYLVIVYHGLS